jgi:hypothetical protein
VRNVKKAGPVSGAESGDGALNFSGDVDELGAAGGLYGERLQESLQ